MSETTHQRHVTKPEDRIPVYSKMSYGSGAFVLQMGNGSVQYMANLIFNIELGVGLGLIGIAMMFFRIFDAVLDPFMGNLSDNSRWKRGRRRPYIFVGAISSGLAFPLIWLVPEGLSTFQTYGLFVVTSLLFYACFTVFAVPWETLSAELSPDYHERTSVVSYRTVLQMVAVSFMGWIYALAQLPMFSTPLEGMRWVGVLVGALIIIFGVLPAIFCKERFQKASASQQKIKFVQSLKLSFSNKPFCIILGMLVLMTLGSNLIISLGQYLNIYYVFGGAKDQASMVQGYTGTVQAISSLAVLPFALWLSRKYGKRLLIVCSLVVMFAATLSKWVLINPAYPNLQILIGLLMGIAVTPFWVGLVAMIGDVADYDEMNSGARREGSYTAIYTWTFKFSLALTLYLGNLILEWSGFQLILAGEQTVETFLQMRIYLVAITAIAVLACLWLVKVYPISEDKAYQIRAELERRRGTV